MERTPDQCQDSGITRHLPQKDSRLICSDFTSTPHYMTPCTFCKSLWTKASAKCLKCECKFIHSGQKYERTVSSAGVVFQGDDPATEAWLQEKRKKKKKKKTSLLHGCCVNPHNSSLKDIWTDRIRSCIYKCICSSFFIGAQTGAVKSSQTFSRQPLPENKSQALCMLIPPVATLNAIITGVRCFHHTRAHADALRQADGQPYVFHASRGEDNRPGWL